MCKGKGSLFTVYGCLAAFFAAAVPSVGVTIPFPEEPYTTDVVRKIEFAGTVGARGRGTGEFIEPKGLCLNADGDLYVVDSVNGRVVVFDETGSPKTTVGRFGWEADGLTRPRDVAVDQELYIYVSDEERNVILQFDIYGKYLKTIGGGTADAELSEPSGIAVDSIGNVWVCDTGNHLVKAFDNAGQVVREIGGFGSDEGKFNNPSGIAIDNTGRIYVADSGNCRIQVFDKFGNFLAAFGGGGEGAGEMNYPSGICLDPYGNIYVADTGGDRIKVFRFDKAGAVLLTQYGSAADRLNRPTGIAIDPAGYLYVADTFNDAVKYYSVTYETVFLEDWQVPAVERVDNDGDTESEPGNLGERFEDLWTDDE